MATFREIGHGQSNRIRDESVSYGQSTVVAALPMLQAMVDPAQAEATFDRQWTPVGGLPMYTGTGVALANVAMTESGGYYTNAGGDHFVEPAAPLDTATFLDWANWPLTARGDEVIAYLTGLSSGVKAECRWIFYKHSEYDSRGYGLNGWTHRDPRVLEFAIRRFMGEYRTALGKSAAELPIFFSVPIPHGPSSNEGFLACLAAFETLVHDRTFNAFWAVRQTMDCLWDADLPGTYTAHGTDADIILLRRRSVYGIAQVLGPLVAPTSNRIWTRNHPEIGWVRQVSDTVLDVYVRHDGGNDLVMPASPALGWTVRYAGAPVSVVSVEKMDKRCLRITLASACAKAAAIRVHYAEANLRLLPGGAVYDNAATWQAQAIAAGVTGDNRIPGALSRTFHAGVVASTAAPGARDLAPVT